MYHVTCLPAYESEFVSDLDRAMEICLSMAEDFESLAQVHDAFGNLVGEYDGATC
jgi:hypothetical protein